MLCSILGDSSPPFKASLLLVESVLGVGNFGHAGWIFEVCICEVHTNEWILGSETNTTLLIGSLLSIMKYIKVHQQWYMVVEVLHMVTNPCRLPR